MFSPLIFVNLGLLEVMAVCLLTLCVMWYLSSCDSDTAGLSEDTGFLCYLSAGVGFASLTEVWYPQ